METHVSHSLPAQLMRQPVILYKAGFIRQHRQSARRIHPAAPAISSQDSPGSIRNQPSSSTRQHPQSVLTSYPAASVISRFSS